MSLKIVVPPRELFNGATGEIFYTKEQVLQLEHSLVSVQKWEAKWHKPFMTQEPKTRDEIVDYIRCMTLTQNVDPNVYFGITQQILDQVYDYMDEPMTATTFPKDNNGGASREVVTAEVIYYRMIFWGVPYECRKWHLNQLLTLIRVCAAKSQPPRKMSQREIMEQNRALNAARKQKRRTRG